MCRQASFFGQILKDECLSQTVTKKRKEQSGRQEQFVDRKRTLMHYSTTPAFPHLFPPDKAKHNGSIRTLTIPNRESQSQ